MGVRSGWMRHHAARHDAVIARALARPVAHRCGIDTGSGLSGPGQAPYLLSVRGSAFVLGLPELGA